MKTLVTILSMLIITNLFAAKDSTNSKWDDYFLPGVGYKYFQPKNHQEVGIYHGIVTEFVVYARAQKQKHKYYSGPSRVKSYANLSILSSNNESANDIFFTNLGINLSFETTTLRNYLIPYFGVELGGMYKKDFKSLQFTPLAGVQLISNKNVIFSSQIGYQYTTKEFDTNSGIMFSSTINVLLWK